MPDIISLIASSIAITLTIIAIIASFTSLKLFHKLPENLLVFFITSAFFVFIDISNEMSHRGIKHSYVRLAMTLFVLGGILMYKNSKSTIGIFSKIDKD